MNFCPRCGSSVTPDQAFCRTCGYDIRARELGAKPTVATLTPPVAAMNEGSLYMIGDEGFTRIGTRLPLVSLAFILGAGLALFVVNVFGYGGWLALTVAFTLLFLPLIGNVRAELTAKDVGLPPDVLAARGQGPIPWQSVRHMMIKGRRLTLLLADRWLSITIDQKDAERLSAKASATLGNGFVQIPDSQRSLSPVTKFFLIAVALFVVTQIITLAASLSPFFPGEQERYTTLYNNVRSGLGTSIFQQWGEIFGNNIQVALEGFVPGFGQLLLSFASYNTGRVIQAAAIHFDLSPSAFLTLLYILPHAWVEEASYPLAGALGLYAFHWRRQSYSEFANWRTRASTKLSMGFATIALVLAIAGVLEVSEPYFGVGALLLWGPVLLAAILVYVRFRRRIADALS